MDRRRRYFAIASKRRWTEQVWPGTDAHCTLGTADVGEPAHLAGMLVVVSHPTDSPSDARLGSPTGASLRGALHSAGNYWGRGLQAYHRARVSRGCGQDEARFARNASLSVALGRDTSQGSIKAYAVFDRSGPHDKACRMASMSGCACIHKRQAAAPCATNKLRPSTNDRWCRAACCNKRVGGP